MKTTFVNHHHCYWIHPLTTGHISSVEVFELEHAKQRLFVGD
jgi:hypothetical protein